MRCLPKRLNNYFSLTNPGKNLAVGDVLYTGGGGGGGGVGVHPFTQQRNDLIRLPTSLYEQLWGAVCNYQSSFWHYICSFLPRPPSSQETNTCISIQTSITHIKILLRTRNEQGLTLPPPKQTNLISKKIQKLRTTPNINLLCQKCWLFDLEKGVKKRGPFKVKIQHFLTKHHYIVIITKVKNMSFTL